MRLSSSMGGEAAALTHPPAMKDSTGVFHNSRSRNQQFDKEGNSGQVQTYKDPPEALAIVSGQPVTMLNNQEKYPVQEPTNKVAPEALPKFSARPVTMWNYYVKCQIQEHLKKITPESMPNYLSILNLPSSSKEISLRFSSVAADISK
jgi:hypothetical protein